MPKLPATTDLDTLIDRALARHEQRTPQWVKHSRALQVLFARLDRALEGDDAALRAEVEAVTADLADLIPWSDQ
jgi:NAD-dependent oxidoreductase involved in siderophore biosynthesis